MGGQCGRLRCNLDYASYFLHLLSAAMIHACNYMTVTLSLTQHIDLML